MYPDHTSNQSLNIANPRSAAPISSVSEMWEKRLDAISDTLFGAQDALDRLSGEHFGPIPETASQGAPTPVPNGRADRISILLDRVTDKAERLRSSANSLANRI